jgi:hypothetical protein
MSATPPNQKTGSDNGCRLFKLVSGEFIIAKIVGSTKNEFFLDRPMTISGFTSMGSMGDFAMVQKQYMCLNNWMEYSLENTVKIRKDLVIALSKPEEKIIEAYNIQKEIEDTGALDKYQKLQISENLDDSCDDITSKLTDDELAKLLNGLIESSEEFIGDQWDRDETRHDYGTKWQDWSPYIEDYLDDDIDPSDSSASS